MHKAKPHCSSRRNIMISSLVAIDPQDAAKLIIFTPRRVRVFSLRETDESRHGSCCMRTFGLPSCRRYTWFRAPSKQHPFREADERSLKERWTEYPISCADVCCSLASHPSARNDFRRAKLRRYIKGRMWCFTQKCSTFAQKCCAPAHISNFIHACRLDY